MAAGKGRVNFLRGVISGRLPMLQQVYPHPCAYRKPKLDFVSYLKKKNYEGDRRSCEGWIWASYIEYLRDSINYNKHITEKEACLWPFLEASVPSQSTTHHVWLFKNGGRANASTFSEKQILFPCVCGMWYVHIWLQGTCVVISVCVFVLCACGGM